jgi:hypothetical protein
VGSFQGLGLLLDSNSEDSETFCQEFFSFGQDGYDIKSLEPHHAYGFYIDAPGGFTIEIGS